MKREWKETKLASAARAVMGQSPPSSSYNETGDGLPFFQGKADFTSFHPSPSKWCTQPLRLAKKNDILMSVRAPVGDVNMSMESCCIGRGLAALSCNPGTNPYFLYFLLGSLKAEIEKRGTGTTFLSINKNVLEQLEIHLPSLPEQKKIAAVLLKIQRAIETQDRMIQSLRDLKKSTMQHLFTHGLRGEKTKMTEIGEIPESWEVVPLKKMGRVGNGSTPKKTNHAYWTNGKIPWLTSGKIHEGIIKAPDQFVTLTAQRECHLPTVRKGGLLIAITGQGKTLGNAAIVDFDSTMSQHLAYVQPDNPDMYPPFIWHYLTTKYEALRQIGFGGGSTKGALTCAALREYPVPCPKTFGEQKEVARILTDLDVKNSDHESQKTAHQCLFKTVLNKLMTGELRVAGLDVDVKEVGV